MFGDLTVHPHHDSPSLLCEDRRTRRIQLLETKTGKFPCWLSPAFSDASNPFPPEGVVLLFFPAMFWTCPPVGADRGKSRSGGRAERADALQALCRLLVRTWRRIEHRGTAAPRGEETSPKQAAEPDTHTHRLTDSQTAPLQTKRNHCSPKWHRLAQPIFSRLMDFQRNPVKMSHISLVMFKLKVL